ncbi:MAG: hypothetical protein Kow0037_07490 [Calditrichia bacterium]
MKIWNKTRVYFQLAIIGVVLYVVFFSGDPEAYCPFGGILSLGSRWINGASSCSMGEGQMFMGIALIVGILILGKLFCSHICPIGTVTEWLGRIARKFKLQIKNIPTALDRVLRVLKYALLLPVLYYTVTSSELFCKTFDPYFALTTGFSMDVRFWWAIAAIALTIIGSFFVNQFWCKYLCPLGALSNIFANFYLGFGALLIYIALKFAGVEISVFWLFLTWVVVGFAIELLAKKSVFLPVFRVERSELSCTNCKVCDRACPYNIEVSRLEKVQDLDCTMCGDCVAACPVKDTLTIRQKDWKWLPSFATILLIIISFGFISQYELTTVAERWGNFENQKNLEKYEQIIKTVKCYGTSMGVVRKLKTVDGVFGVDTYAKTHKVVVYFDPEVVSPKDIKKTLFSTYKSWVRKPNPNTPNELSVAYLEVSNIDDNIDNVNFLRAIRKSESVYAFETFFGEPVRVLVYYDPATFNADSLIKHIEAKKIQYRYKDELKTVELDFKVYHGPEHIAEVDLFTLKNHLFKKYEYDFKKYKEYDESQIKVFQTGLVDGDNFLKARYLPYITSHLSNYDGILRVQTRLADRPVILVYFDPAQIDTTTISRQLQASKILVTYRTGEKKEVDNPFKFEGPSAVLSVKEIENSEAALKSRLTFLDKFHE